MTHKNSTSIWMYFPFTEYVPRSKIPSLIWQSILLAAPEIVAAKVPGNIEHQCHSGARGCKYLQKCVECGRGMILQIMLRQWVSLWTFWRLMAGTPRHPRTLLILHAAPGNVAAQDPGDKPQFCSGENELTKSCSLIKIKIKMFNELWRSLRIVPHSHLVPVYCCNELWSIQVRKSNLLSFYLWF